MDEGRLPYETLVLVCTNKRGDGERPGCADAGRCGAALREKLKEEVASRGLKLKVRVSASGCLDLCKDGPNVVIMGPKGKSWFKNVAEGDVSSLIDKIAKGDTPHHV